MEVKKGAKEIQNLLFGRPHIKKKRRRTQKPNQKSQKGKVNIK